MEECELKKLPCPHCGNKQINYFHESDWFWYCEACGLRGPRAKDSVSAIAAWNALPRRLKWTREKPTVEGFYWFKPIVEGKAGVVTVFYYTPGSEVAAELIGDDDGVFAGPIPEP